MAVFRKIEEFSNQNKTIPIKLQKGMYFHFVSFSDLVPIQPTRKKTKLCESGLITDYQLFTGFD